MIVTELYKGQGLGNQLAVYITTRVIALDRGYDFGIMHGERFKGADFLDLDFGREVLGGSGPEGGPPRTLPEEIRHYYCERRATHPENGADIRLYDEDLTTVLDSTKLEGLMQDERYFAHRKGEIKRWLTIKNECDCRDYADENICIINFRGGEYTRHPELFLSKRYWNDAIKNMRKINPRFRFVVITDDTSSAQRFFPEHEVFHFSIAKDYSIINNAHYLILSNSSFAWFPAWLNENLKYCIAPKYWARHNISDGYWSMGQNLTRGFMYQDRNGNLSDYDSCMSEFSEYMKNHAKWFSIPKIENNFLVVSNYNNDVRWVPEYTDNYMIYDRSENPILPEKIDLKKVIQAPNIGYNLYDYFTFIIDNYENLPDCTIFVKGNIFPRHMRREEFERVMNSASFMPLVDKRLHRFRFPLSFFSSPPASGIRAGNIFHEINTSWYLKHFKNTYFNSYGHFLRFLYKNPTMPLYVPFAPGGNYIVPKATILKIPKIVYENLRLIISHDQLAGEAHLVERALYTLWTKDGELNPDIQKPLDENGIKEIASGKDMFMLEKLIRKISLCIGKIYI